MFGRKKTPKEPDYTKTPVLPNKLAEFVQAKYGLSPEELLKLCTSIERVNKAVRVARRRKVEGKEYSNQTGKILTIAEAVQYEHERVENRLARDQKIRELLEGVDFEELMVRLEVSEEIYPKRLAPSDIVRYVDSAGEKLDALDRDRTKPMRIYSPREETVLDVITLIKKQEALRVARRIADRQRAYVLGKTMEELEAEHAEWLRQLRGDPTEEERLAMEEAERLAVEAVAAEEERIAAEAATRNFGDLASVYTLLDEVAKLIQENPEAAAAIVCQWIGHTVLMEGRS